MKKDKLGGECKCSLVVLRAIIETWEICKLNNIWIWIRLMIYRETTFSRNEHLLIVEYGRLNL